MMVVVMPGCWMGCGLMGVLMLMTFIWRPRMARARNSLLWAFGIQAFAVLVFAVTPRVKKPWSFGPWSPCARSPSPLDILPGGTGRSGGRQL